MKKIKAVLGKLFNRMTILAILIFVQFGYIAFALLKLGNYTQYTSIAFTVLSVLMALFVIYRDDNPTYKLSWILLICLLPVLGSTMYVFFGNKRPARRLKSKIKPLTPEHGENLNPADLMAGGFNPRLARLVEYVTEYGPYPAWDRTDVRYYALADDAFPEMLRDLAKAKKFIFLEYFIISRGYMWDQIFQILREKVKEGVDVRLIYDDFGSMEGVPVDFASTMEGVGIKTLAFNPIRPIASLVYNNRDHRKILVIDGNIAYTGGFNIGDEYINRVKKYGHWKDTGLRLAGAAVWNDTLMFLNIWNAFRPTDESFDAFRPTETALDKGVQLADAAPSINSTSPAAPCPLLPQGIVQPFADSPLDSENVGENVYMEIINEATDYVYIYTPYLILGNEILTCLQFAAKRGVDVRLVTPGIPDKRIVYRLTRSYYRPLLKAGVRIYEYTPGFIHAKSCVADDKAGVVGSINLDYRSLYLHFECGTLLMQAPVIRDIRRDAENTFALSREVHIEDFRNTFPGILYDSVLRMFSPLL